MLAAGLGPLANLVALLVSVVVFVGLPYFTAYRARQTQEGGGEAGSLVSRVVVGAVAAAAIYTVLYVLATVFENATWGIPAAAMYPLYVYAFIGCLAMVVVLPIFALRQSK